MRNVMNSKLFTQKYNQHKSESCQTFLHLDIFPQEMTNWSWLWVDVIRMNSCRFTVLVAVVTGISSKIWAMIITCHKLITLLIYQTLSDGALN